MAHHHYKPSNHTTAELVGIPPPDTLGWTPGTELQWLRTFATENQWTTEDLRRSCMVHGNGVTLRPSSFPGAGLGVFATRDVRAGTLVTEYDGLWLDPTAFSQLPDQPERTSHRYVPALTGDVEEDARGFYWNILANYRLSKWDAASDEDGGGESSWGYVRIRDPVRETYARGLGGYMNTLTQAQRDTHAFNMAHALVWGTDFDTFYKEMMRAAVTRYMARRVVMPTASEIAQLVPAMAREVKTRVFRERPDLYFVGAFALRDITAGEELVWDYGTEYRGM